MSDDAKQNDREQLDEPNFSISIDNIDDTVTKGENISVTATVDNTGDQTGDGTLEFSIGSTGSDPTSLSISGGNSETQTLSIPTSEADVGDYTATISVSGDGSDSTSRNIIIQEPLSSGVSSVSTANSDKTLLSNTELGVLIDPNKVGDPAQHQTAFNDAVKNDDISVTEDDS